MIKKNFLKFKESEKGVTLYMALLILSAVLAMSSAVLVLMLGEFKLAGDVQKSMAAVYAADSGLEVALYKARHQSQGDATNLDCAGGLGLSMPANSSCNINISGAGVIGGNVTIDATGTYAGFNRKIQSIYLNK